MRIWVALAVLPAALKGAEIHRAPAPFQAAGLYCAAGEPVRARTSSDGVRWSDWRETHVHAPGEGGLVWPDEPQRYLEINQMGCRVLWIDPGPAPKARKEPPARLSADAPPIVTRAQWGCTPQSCPAAAPPAFTMVTHLVVHHSAGANQASDWAAVVRAIWQLHVRGNGWNDIGYNYLIDPEGVIYEGRAGGDGVLGAHFSGVNSGTMGVCLLGTYSTEAASEKALAALQVLLAWQARKWRIDPGGRELHAASGLRLATISGHRDAGLSPRASGRTECPGNGLYAALPALRREIAATESACPRIERNYRCSGAKGQRLRITLPACRVPPVVESRAAWIQAAVDDGDLLVDVAANAEPVPRFGTLVVHGQTLEIAQAGAGARAGADAPACPDRILGAIGFDERPLAPGALFTVFGEGMMGESLEVAVNGRPAQVLYASAEQINARLPVETLTGSARLTLSVDGVAGIERLFWVTEAVPAIAAIDGDFTAGGVIRVLVNGAGRAAAPWSASIGEARALSPAPGLPGLHVAEVRLPADLEPGDYSFSIRMAGVSSTPAPLRIIPSP